MRIAVMGAGAVGGYFGGVLARFGEEVTLICRGAHGDAIRRDGLRLSTYWGDFTVTPPAIDDPAEAGPVDLVLYCVKTYSNPVVARLIRPLVGPETTVLTLQNGVTSAGRLAAEYGAERVLPGAAYIEAALTGPGQIEQTGSTARIVFGEPDGKITPRIGAILQLLSREGIQPQATEDITGALWTKLVSVGAIGTVMTAARASLPEVISGPEGESTIRTVMHEIVAVGTVKGVRFPPDVVDTRLSEALSEAEAFKSSLQLDFQLGHPLEIDDLIGAVVREGRALGVPTPAGAALYTALYKFKDGPPGP